MGGAEREEVLARVVSHWGGRGRGELGIRRSISGRRRRKRRLVVVVG